MTKSNSFFLVFSYFLSVALVRTRLFFMLGVSIFFMPAQAQQNEVSDQNSVRSPVVQFHAWG
jgi:hypothetical protein